MGLFDNIAKEKPQIVLFSVGGNELMGNIEDLVYPYSHDRPRDKYIYESKISSILDYIEGYYQSVTDRIVTNYAAEVHTAWL